MEPPPPPSHDEFTASHAPLYPCLPAYPTKTNTPGNSLKANALLYLHFVSPQNGFLIFSHIHFFISYGCIKVHLIF